MKFFRNHFFDDNTKSASTFMNAPYFYGIKEGLRAHDCWLIFIYSDIDILLKKLNGFRAVNDLRRLLQKIYIIHNLFSFHR